ncbi:MAG: hypothetical protein JRC86_09305 [Deltaproteobacteria bacterium]|nr:hypothetical protein [Deltaproteobacteria bacterium]
MDALEFIYLWPDNPFLSITVLYVVTVFLFYTARQPACKAIHATAHVMSNGLRFAANWTMESAEALRKRNQTVIIEQGAQETEHQIEREFTRIESIVTQDLSKYPELHRKLSDQIAKIDADYQECGETPPPPPGWTEAVAAIANVKQSQDAMVAKVLGEIHKTLAGSQKKAGNAYIKSSAERHKILKTLMPFWRNLTKTLDRVERVITGVKASSNKIDGYMTTYENIRKNDDQTARMFASSYVTQFLTSLLVLIIACGGGFINFNLIALPMSEMVAGSNYVAGMRIADLSALVLVLMEAAAGLFLMESLGITHLFPSIGYMKDNKRRLLMLIAGVGLLFLATVESSLALLREHIVADNAALKQALAGASADAVPLANSMIPTIVQMMLGFILPWILAMIAIPLEVFIRSARIIIGDVMVLVVKGTAFFQRVLANITDSLGSFLVGLYDVYIFFPLWVENTIKSVMANRSSPSSKEHAETLEHTETLKGEAI